MFTSGTFAAKAYLVLTGVVVLFQLALAMGAPWGEFTMGGAVRGQLPARMRIAAIGSAVLLSLFGAIVASHAGLAFRGWQPPPRWLIWVVCAYGMIGVALNAVTPSARERAIWLPVAVMMAICAVIVARADPRGSG